MWLCLAASCVTVSIEPQSSSSPTPRSPSSSDRASGLAQGLRCVPVPLSEEIPAQVSMAWAPTGASLAVGRIRDSHSATTPVELIVLSEPSWTPEARGGGSSPRWSASGALLSAVDNGAIRVLDAKSGAERARLPTTAESGAWQGEELRYWAGPEIRAWSASGDRLLARVGLADPPSPALEPTLSSDGQFFAIARFNSAGTATDLYLGRTADGSARREDAPSRGYQWSTSGHTIFFQRADHAVVRFDPFGPDVNIVNDDPVLYGWDQTGTRPLIRGSTRDGTLILKATDGSRALAEYAVPVESGAFLFTADGRYGATTAAAPRIRTLSLLRCS